MKGKKDKLFSKKVLTFSANGCIIVLKIRDKQPTERAESYE